MRSTLVFTVILILLLTSCTEQKLPEVAQIDVTSEELNSRIALDAPSGWNDFRLRNAITLTVKNVSTDDIIFDSSYGVRIFIYDDSGAWKEVDDRLISLTLTDKVLRPIQTHPTDTGTISVLPNLGLENERLTIRIFVIGYLYRNNVKTSTRTGAYIDIRLKP